MLQYLFILVLLVLMPSHQPAKPPRYSSTYEDDMYQYRHVIVDKGMVSLIPKNRLMDECEWRALGVKQGSHWEHYLIHKPEPYVLMFRRLLKYRNELTPSLKQQQQNTHFPTTHVPMSATMNFPSNYALADSTNKKTNLIIPGAPRLTMNNQFSMLNRHVKDDMNESGFESHCDN